MAVYIRFADSEGVSPLIVGSAINPANYNWGGSDTNYVSQTGNYTKGSNILSWLKTNSIAFSGFIETNMRTNTNGEFYKEFLLYDSSAVKMTFRVRVNGGSWYYTVGVTGAGPAQILLDQRRFYSIRTADIDSLIQDELGEYGIFLICNPHVQQTPTDMGLIWTWNSQWNTAYSPDYRFRDNIFFPLTTYGDASRYKTYIRALFYNSGQSTGPDSDEDGGWGDFNDGSDTISLPGLPGLSALSSGFVNMYNPTAAEITTMAQILWTTDPGTAIKNWLQAPMDSIVSLGIMPLAPDISSTKVHVVVGNFVISTNDLPPVYMDSYPLTNQYKIFDCGSLNLNEYWGNALDYSPYSKAEIFLPYIGVKEIDINDVMAATLHLQYIVDFLTGTCTAQLQCVKAQHMDFSAPLYHWQGNMMSQIPTNGADFGQFITAITSTLVSAGLTVATGGSGAVIAAGVAGGALNMANAHPRIEKGGTIAMIAGAMDSQTPYIILTRPIQSKPAGFENYKGWPSNITAEIGSLSGYTEVEYVHVEVAGATDEERNEIERLLKEGVII